MSTQPPAGWYPDPADPQRTRWWDGVRWADPAPAPAQPAAPAAWPSAAPPVQVAATHVDASPNTVWIWLVVLITTIPSFAFLLFDWQGLVDAIVELAKTGQATTPMISRLSGAGLGVILVSSLGGLVALVLSIVFSYLDWRELGRRGIPRPFHWLFALIALVATIGVYVIGRSVVAHRATGRGFAPMWVWIALTVASLVIGAVFVSWLVNAIVTGVGPVV